ncbi:MAG: hypothetical protein HOP09_09430 [Hyphomicrobium sp.]|nr:hypothetical protein [Hyphomicrobium sp.]
MFHRNSAPRLRAPILAAMGAIVFSAVAAGTAGCNEYLDRRDTITLGAGDATETNKAVQTITRWPAASSQDRWTSDGERARTAIARYRAGKVIAPKTLSGKAGAVSESAPATPDVPVEAGSTAPK